MCSSLTVRPRGCTMVSPTVKSSYRLSSRVKCTLTLQQSLGDHFVLNLGSSLEDPEHARIAPEALRGKLARITIAAEDLHRFRRHVLGHLGAKSLRHPRFQIAALAGVLH